MSVPLLTYFSRGAFERTQRFERTRKQVLDVLEPSIVNNLFRMGRQGMATSRSFEEMNALESRRAQAFKEPRRISTAEEGTLAALQGLVPRRIGGGTGPQRLVREAFRQGAAIEDISGTDRPEIVTPRMQAEQQFENEGRRIMELSGQLRGVEAPRTAAEATAALDKTAYREDWTALKELRQIFSRRELITDFVTKLAGREPSDKELEGLQTQLAEMGAGNVSPRGSFLGAIPLGPLGTELPSGTGHGGLAGTIRDVLQPQVKTEGLRDVPVIGESLERSAAGLSSPLGTAGAIAAGPAATIAGELGAVGAGTTARELGAETGVQIGAEVLGGLATPGMLTAPGRAAARAGRTAIEESATAQRVGRTLAGEAGTTRVPPNPVDDVVDVTPPRTELSPNVEAALTRATDTGVDRRLFDHAVQAAAENAPEVGRIRSVFNRARSVLDPALARNPDMQLSYLAATRYGDAQVQRLNGIVAGVERGVVDSFGEEGLGGVAVMRSAYRGPSTAGKAVDRYVGTVWHVLDNPTLYRLTPAQQRLVQYWDDITRGELRFSRDVGVEIGEWEGSWIAHSFKDPDKATSILARPKQAGKPGSFKPRKHTTEEFAEIAAEHGLEIDTNVVDIIARRLASSARQRANVVFLDELTKKVGGGRLLPGRSVPIGNRAVQVGGKQWYVPESVGDDVSEVLGGRRLQPDEQLVNQAVDATRGVLLNLDFSVGGMRQGYLAFVSDPLGAIKSYGQAAMIMASPEGWLDWYVRNGDQMEYWAQNGLSLRTSPLDITQSVRGRAKQLIERLPIVGKLNEVQFEIIMPLQKVGRANAHLGMLQAIRDDRGLAGLVSGVPGIGRIVKRLGGKIATMTDDQLAEVVADAENNWMGGIEWARIGQSPSVLRKLAILTEGWTRAQIGVILNAPKLSPKGIMARRMLMQEVALTATASTALSLSLSGKLPNYDPRSSDFLDVVTPVGRISILPHKTILRTAVRGLMGKPPDEYGSDDPLRQRFDAAYSFFEGRTGQLPRMAVDLIRGRDYFDRPISNKAIYALEQFSPIIAQQVFDDIRSGASPTEIAGRTAAEFAGGSAKPFRRGELLDQAYQAKFDEPYDPNGPQRFKALADEELAPLVLSQSPEAQERRRILAEFEAELLPFAEGVLAGNAEAGTKYRDGRSRYLQQAEGATRALFAGTDFDNPDSEAGKLLSQLFDETPDKYTDTNPEEGTFETDWSAWEAKRTELLDAMDKIVPGSKAAIENYVRFQDPKLQQVEGMYLEARGFLDELDKMSPVSGLSRELYDEAIDLRHEALRERERLAREKGMDVDTQVAYEWVARQHGYSPAVADLIRQIGSSTYKQKNANLDYYQFLVDHKDTIQLFYPDMYPRWLQLYIGNLDRAS